MILVINDDHGDGLGDCDDDGDGGDGDCGGADGDDGHDSDDAGDGNDADGCAAPISVLFVGKPRRTYYMPILQFVPQH